VNSDVIKADEQTFTSTVLESDLPVLVDFWASWCGPCRMLAPTIDEFATEYKDKLRVVKVNTDENQAMLARYGIRGIPTLILFSHGEEVDRIVGYASKNHLKSRLDAALEKTAAPA
jgi:thioredoxin 1